MKPIVVGISGKQLSGKSTLASGLVTIFQNKNDTYRYIHTEILHFADYLKEIVAKCFFGKDKFDADMKTQIVYGKTGRELLQLVGTDWFRNIAIECWINALNAEIQKFVDMYKNNDSSILVILIPDVRFENELNYIQKKLNGHVIRLTRNPKNDQHESETALDDAEMRTGTKYTVPPRPYETTIFDTIIDNRSLGVQDTLEIAYDALKNKGVLDDMLS